MHDRIDGSLLLDVDTEIWLHERLESRCLHLQPVAARGNLWEGEVAGITGRLCLPGVVIAIGDRYGGVREHTAAGIANGTRNSSCLSGKGKRQKQQKEGSNAAHIDNRGHSIWNDI